MKFNYRRLKAERIAKGFTGDYVAEQMGISKSYYSKKENAKSPLDVDEFAEILTILGVSNSELHIFFTNNVSEMETNEIW